jgi:FMN phosphatase YigB (HAD superfamily)
MSIRYILFDLDGTLLPMDQDHFIRTYMGALSNYMEPHGFDSQHFIQTVWQGTGAMFKNDGSATNEEVFWQNLISTYGPEVRRYEAILDTFYHTRFADVQSCCGYDPKASRTIKALKEMGFELVLATQPVFPAIATETRIKWAGLNRDDFKLYTTYENSSFCKPNPDYYRQILDKIGANASQCLMVGNDATEDLVAQTLGMKVFLLTGCLINKENKDLSEYPQGNLDALLHYIQSM